MYVINGTANGTVLLNDDFIEIRDPTIHVANARDSSLADCTPAGDGNVPFAGATQADAIALWITDGTFAGTAALTDSSPSYTVTISLITSLGNGTALFDFGSGAAREHHCHRPAAAPALPRTIGMPRT